MYKVYFFPVSFVGQLNAQAQARVYDKYFTLITKTLRVKIRRFGIKADLATDIILTVYGLRLWAVVYFVAVSINKWLISVLSCVEMELSLLARLSTPFHMELKAKLI